MRKSSRGCCSRPGEDTTGRKVGGSQNVLAHGICNHQVLQTAHMEYLTAFEALSLKYCERDKIRCIQESMFSSSSRRKCVSWVSPTARGCPPSSVESHVTPTSAPVGRAPSLTPTPCRPLVRMPVIIRTPPA